MLVTSLLSVFLLFVPPRLLHLVFSLWKMAEFLCTVRYKKPVLHDLLCAADHSIRWHRCLRNLHLWRSKWSRSPLVCVVALIHLVEILGFASWSSPVCHNDEFKMVIAGVGQNCQHANTMRWINLNLIHGSLAAITSLPSACFQVIPKSEKETMSNILWSPCIKIRVLRRLAPHNNPLHCEQSIMSSVFFIFEYASQHSNSLWAVMEIEIQCTFNRTIRAVCKDDWQAVYCDYLLSAVVVYIILLLIAATVMGCCEAVKPTCDIQVHSSFSDKEGNQPEAGCDLLSLLRWQKSFCEDAAGICVGVQACWPESCHVGLHSCQRRSLTVP